jgi:hypothetical protein
MFVPIVLPIIAGVVAVGVGLRLHALSKLKFAAKQSLAKDSTLQAPSGSTTKSPVRGTEAFNKPIIKPAVAFPPDTATEAEKMDAAMANLNAAKASPASVDNVALAAKQAGVTVQELQDAARFMGTDAGTLVAMGTSPRDLTDAVFQMKAARNQSPGVSSAALVALPLAESLKPAGQKAIVTTHDPSPSGDLMIRIAPSPTSPTIEGGGADKGGTVTIVRDVDPTWAEVIWDGGNRPAGRGFARKAFLKLI